MMNNNLNKFMIFNTICISLLGSHIAYCSVQALIDEVGHLENKRTAIVNQYIPNNISKTAFNEFNNPECTTVTVNEIDFQIYDLAGNKDSEEYKKTRQDFVDQLPHDYAYLSNQIYPLTIKSEFNSQENILKVNCSYATGLFGSYEIAGYNFNVQPIISFSDKNLLTTLTKRISSIPSLIIDDTYDRNSDISKYLPTVDQFKIIENDHIKSLTQQMFTTIEPLIAEYQDIKSDRLRLTDNYDSLLDEEKAWIRHYNINVLEYRNWLIDNINKIAKISQTFQDNDSNESAITQYAAAMSILKQYAPLYKLSLINFSKWFVDKDKTAFDYGATYKTWQ